MSTLQPDSTAQITALQRELDIPANYGSSRQLPLHVEATELVSIGKSPEGNDCRLIRPAAHAWHRMQAAAQSAGVELLPLSGFRSIERQAEIIRGKLAVGEKISDILRSIAAPGYSEHHTGRAIDVGCHDEPPLEEAFANTRSFAWLVRHADEFGFNMSFPKHNPNGFVYEPWHWCWHAKASALRIGLDDVTYQILG
jgi:D-alanyl-D-alanine carboxypeptidase